MPFSNLGLSDQLVQGILATGYTAPTEIQLRAIPVALQGKDVIGCAQTGTGKTAAFVLPLLNRLTKDPSRSHRHPRALVLTPTRELCQQVEDSVITYGRFAKLATLAVYGGVNMENQRKRLQRGVDVVIATPGRLLDHLQQRTIDLSKVEVLVVDEADRMFDMGFIADVKKIIAKVPTERQTLLFSATMSKEVRALTASIQKHPDLIEIGERHKPVETVTQHFYSIPQNQKLELLLYILGKPEMDSVLVFSRTKHGADKVSRRLEKTGVKAIAIHSNRTQAQRQQALAGFKQGRFKVLVATDIAARGIDVDGISHVVNFDTPTFAEDYIHRIGRTGRATLKGDALTFVSNEERGHLRKIESFVGKRFDLKRYPDFVFVAKPEAPAEAGHHRSSDSRYPRRSGQSYSGQSRSGQRPSHGERSSHGEKPSHAERPSHGERQPATSGYDQSKFSRPVYKKRPERRATVEGSTTKSTPQHDWRKLITTPEEEKSTFRKKLRKVFRRR